MENKKEDVKNKDNTVEKIQEETTKSTSEKNVKTDKKKNNKVRMKLVLLFLVIFAAISYISLRGNYLEF